MTNPTEITNIIELTNLVEITKTTTETLTNTITNVVTNILDKIDIVSVDKLPTDWVSFFGAVATVLGAVATIVSAIYMYRSVSEMKKQRETEYSQNLIEKIEGIVQKFILYILESEEYKNVRKRNEDSHMYEYLIFLTKNSDERNESLWLLKQLRYIIKLNNNKTQLRYFDDIRKQISTIEVIMCKITKVYAGNKASYSYLTEEQKQQIHNLQNMSAITNITNVYVRSWQSIRLIPTEEYKELDEQIKHNNRRIDEFKKMIEEKSKENKN